MTMRQWKFLVVLCCFPQPPWPSWEEEQEFGDEEKLSSPPPLRWLKHQEEVVRLVGCDGHVHAYCPPVIARDLMQEHPWHLVCHADALLIGEKIPAVAPGEELQPGEAYILLPAHLFSSVLSYMSLTRSLIQIFSNSTAAASGGKRPHQPYKLCHTDSGKMQIKFSDNFLLVGSGSTYEESEAKKKEKAVLRGDKHLEKEYEALVGYHKSHRWVPKLEPIQEVIVVAGSTNTEASSSPTSERCKSQGLPFLSWLRILCLCESSPSSNGGGASVCSGS